MIFRSGVRQRADSGPEGVTIRLRGHNLAARQQRALGSGMPRPLALGVLLAAAFYLLSHYSIVAGVWPVHGTAPGAGGMLIRDALALAAWLLVFPAFRAMGYRGSWAIVALPAMIFLMTRPSQFQLFTDPVYQATSATRAEANTLKAERARLTTILRAYDEERVALVFEGPVPALPEPVAAIRAATAAERRSPAALASLFTVVLAPLTVILTFGLVRRRGAVRWFRDHRAIPFGLVLAIFFGLTLFFVELGRVAGTTPWELFLPLFVAAWAAVLADDVYNIARAGTAFAPRRILSLLAYGALPVVPFLLIRELGLSVVLAGSLATMLLVGTRRPWWAGLMLVVWGVLVAAAFQLDPRSATRLQLAIDPYRDLATMTATDAERWAARMHQFKLFDANVIEGGLFGAGAGRGHPETAPNAADDGYITTIAAHWGFFGTVGLVLLYTAFILHLLVVASREESAFERTLVTGLAMLLAIPFWMATLGGVRAVPLTGVATAFAAHGGAKLLASAAVVGIIAAISHRRGEAERLQAAADSVHPGDIDAGVRIR